MATTYTASAAKTFTRIELLKTQIRVALLRSTDINGGTLDRVMLGIDNRWIQKIDVWALDKSKLCRAQLAMQIDWKEHEGKLAIGRATVMIDERWSNDTAIEVQEAIRLFDSFSRAKGLRREWTIGYVSWVDRDEINKKLGFVRADPVKWAGSTEELEFQIPELSEFRVGCRLVTD